MALLVHKDFPFTLENNGNGPTNVNSAKQKGSRGMCYSSTRQVQPLELGSAGTPMLPIG